MSASDITPTRGTAIPTSSVRKTIIAKKKPGYAVDAGFVKQSRPRTQAVALLYLNLFAGATTTPTATVAKQTSPVSAFLSQVLAYNKQQLYRTKTLC